MSTDSSRGKEENIGQVRRDHLLSFHLPGDSAFEKLIQSGRSCNNTHSEDFNQHLVQSSVFAIFGLTDTHTCV